MNFIKNHWFSILLIAILCFILLYSQKQNEELVNQIKVIEKLNLTLEKQSEKYLFQIDSLSKLDPVYIETIKTITKIEYEKTASIDTMSLRSLQQFFTDRYK